MSQRQWDGCTLVRARIKAPGISDGYVCRLEEKEFE
jgi:hypothetical protein